MQESMVIQGRCVTPQDIQWLRRLIKENPTWHRKRLSIEICQLWNWRAANGQLKDMACRNFLLKLERLGHILLPPPLKSANNALRHRAIQPVLHQKSPLVAELHALRPIRIAPVQDRWNDELFNMRFLILPWVRVPHLASHLLGQVAKRIAADWIRKYSHPLYLLETFVDCERFRGVCYQAANWRHLGQTKGRTRNDRYSSIQVPIKAIYLYPLTPNFREALTA